MDLNPNATVSQIREKFIKTCVSSCVLCYVLGVGDRHMENILVTRLGKLLHIDFSYILGDDPKHLKVEMKITEDMLQMLGGQNSESFKIFKKYCKEAYKLLRQRSSLWYILLTYLEFSVPSIDKFKYNSETIRNHVNFLRQADFDQAHSPAPLNWILKDKIKWLDQYLYRRGKTLDGLDKRYIEWIEDLRTHHEE